MAEILEIAGSPLLIIPLVHEGPMMAQTRSLSSTFEPCRPERLHSSLEYAARFVDPNRLWSAETGGPFTIARAAVQYLSHLDPAALSA